MHINEITIDVEGADSIYVKPAGDDYPDLFAVNDGLLEEPIYLTEEAAVQLVEAIRKMKETQ